MTCGLWNDSINSRKCFYIKCTNKVNPIPWHYNNDDTIHYDGGFRDSRPQCFIGQSTEFNLTNWIKCEETYRITDFKKRNTKDFNGYTKIVLLNTLSRSVFVFDSVVIVLLLSGIHCAYVTHRELFIGSFIESLEDIWHSFRQAYPIVAHTISVSLSFE